MYRWIAKATSESWLALGLVLFTAGPVAAQIVNEENVGRLTIGPSIGFLLPSMGDVNDNLDVVNRFLAREDVVGLDDVNQALLTGLDIRYRLGNTPDTTETFMDRLTVGFNWGAINVHRQLEVTRADVRFFSRATTYSAYVLYHLPYLESKWPARR